MMKVIGTFVAILVLIVVVYPFLQDAYQRYQIAHRLDAVMDARERSEFRQWSGDAKSFAQRLYDRCELSQGKGAVQCERYRSALE
jgi:hypothetical protein